MSDETRKLIDQAKDLVDKAGRGGTSSMAGSAASLNEGWTPRTLEIKGFSSFTERFRRGVSCEFAAEFTDKLQEKLPDEYAAFIDWDRSSNANRCTFCFKITLVMKDDVEREQVFQTKSEIGELLKQPELHIRGVMCFCAAQASPMRRELYASAGKYTTVFEGMTGSIVETRREYGSPGVVMLARRLDDDKKKDKNSHLAATWTRISEWSSRSKSWRHHEKELDLFVVAVGELSARLSES